MVAYVRLYRLSFAEFHAKNDLLPNDYVILRNEDEILVKSENLLRGETFGMLVSHRT